jgi:site-specific recombinase XerD
MVMASIRKKGKNYFIKFSFNDYESGLSEERSFSLKTSNKRDAERLQLQMETDFEEGLINPFDKKFSLSEYRKNRNFQTQREQGVTLKEMCELFLKERPNITQGTANAYERHFRMMMDQWGATLPVHYIDESNIREFCFKTHLRPKTQKSYLTHLKAFFGWLHEKGITKKNVSAKIKPPRVGDEIQKKIITTSQFQKVLETHHQHQKKNTDKGYIKKDAQKQLWFVPIMSLYYYAGLRLKEGTKLRWSRVDFSNRQIHVVNSAQARTKSGKDRTVQMRKELYEVLKDWHTSRGEPLNGLVFPSPTSTKMFDYELRPERVSKQFKKFSRLAGLSEDITLHSLRHSFVTNLIRDGVGPIHVMHMAGHASLETTKIYEHISSNDIRDKFIELDL